MNRELRFTATAEKQYTNLKSIPSNKGVFKQVQKTLGYLETNLRHPSLQTHEYYSLTRLYGEKVFEAYIQQDSPEAYRVFFHYGPDEANESGKRIPIITIVAITPHP